MSKALETCTIDKRRKNLYSNKLKKKIISKYVYIYAYVPIRKATQASQFELKVLSNLQNSKLVNLFSMFTFFHNYLVQGPRIHIIIAQSLFFEKIKELQEVSIIICFFDFKWYAFFILLEINLKYPLLFKLCFELKLKTEINPVFILSYQK
jgi:hypothetical protein